jgi:hypothetical protein
MGEAGIRLDPSQIEAVIARIEADGLSLTPRMRLAVMEALQDDPGYSLPSLKNFALLEGEPTQVAGFRADLARAMFDSFQQFAGSASEAAIPGMALSAADLNLHIDVAYVQPDEPCPQSEAA